MINQSFDQFINQQTEASQKNEVDWATELGDWKRHLSDFYEKVNMFLKSYIVSGKVTLKKRAVELYEECIGSYTVDALDIVLGETKIILMPVGTNLIGAKGRVDMKGPRGTVKFVLVSKALSVPKINIQIRTSGEEQPAQEEINPFTVWEWKISTPPPRINYIELEEESFKTALMEVVNG